MAAKKVTLALAGLAAVSLLYCAPFLTHLSTRVAGDAGDAMLVAYNQTWVAEHLGTPEMWNPPFFHPTPNVLAYSDHLIGPALLAWPAIAAGLSPVAIVNLLQWLAFLLTSAAVFWWLLESRGDVLPSAAAAVTVTYGAWRAAQLSHPQLLFMPFLPLALICYGRAIERRGGPWLVWAGAAALVCQTLFTASLTVFMMPLVAIWIASSALGARRTEPRLWLALAASLAAVGVANVPIAVHYWELGPAFERGPIEIGQFSVRWRDWLSVPASHWLYGDVLTFTRGWERELFPGIGFLAVLGLGIAARPHRWPALVTVAMAVWASTGPSPPGERSLAHLPYDLIVAFVPGGRHVRVPARFYPVVAIFLAPIMAAGWTRVRDWTAARVARPALAGVLTVVLLALTVAEGVPGAAGSVPAPDLTEAALPAELASGAVLFLPLGDPRVETLRVWRARRSGLPTVNGYSGHTAPLWEKLRHLQTAPTDDQTRRALYTFLLQFGVDTIVIDEPMPAIVDPNLLRPLADGVYRIPAGTPQPRLQTIGLARGVGLLVPEAGWSYPEGSADGSWVWSVDRRATLLVPMDGSPVREMALRIRGLYPDGEAAVELRWNGQSLGSRSLSRHSTSVRFLLPEAATRAGWTRFELRGPAPIPVSTGPDPRRLSVALYEITFG